MFTGIIQGTREVVGVERRPDFLRFAVRLGQELGQGLEPGASVAIDGVCQTVTTIDGEQVWFDAMEETLRVTTLSELQRGDHVNVERSLRAGQEVGGHEVSGHIDGMLEIAAIGRSEDNCVFTLRYPQAYSRYIFNKGFLGIHGASLTVSDLDRATCTFKVYLIPETLRLTNLGIRKPGDRLNFEIDRRTQAIVDTVQAFLKDNLAGMTQE